MPGCHRAPEGPLGLFKESRNLPWDILADGSSHCRSEAKFAVDLVPRLPEDSQECSHLAAKTVHMC